MGRHHALGDLSIAAIGASNLAGSRLVFVIGNGIEPFLEIMAFGTMERVNDHHKKFFPYEGFIPFPAFRVNRLLKIAML
jgi:hypothetical protein